MTRGKAPPRQVGGTPSGLATRFAVRIRAAADLAQQSGLPASVVQQVRSHGDLLGKAVGDWAMTCIRAFVDERCQQAVAERAILLDRWPLIVAPRQRLTVFQALDQVLGILDASGDGATDGGWRWPPEAAPRDVAAWVHTMQPEVAQVLAREAAADRTPATVEVPTTSGSFPLPTRALALLYLATREVEEDRRRPTVRFGANKLARAAIQVMSMGPQLLVQEEDKGRLELTEETGRLAIAWKGSTKPVQLALEWNDLPTAALRGIMETLHEDGVRDWLLLHRMDADQGGAGEFTWTWQEHRERSLYARRIGQRNSTDEELQRAVSERLRLLARAELRIQQVVPFRGKTVTKWIRVGDRGLIDMPAGVNSFSGFEAARIRVLRELRATSPGDAESGRCFALVSEEALMLAGGELRLAAVLACDRWYAAEATQGIVTRKARYLWETSTLRGGDPSPKRRKAAADALHRLLDRLAAVDEIGDWKRIDEGDVSPETKYVITPPRWWRDQVVHRVPPGLPTTSAGLPRTGLELRAWREARGWSQSEAARRLGVNQATLSRAEAAGTAPLGERLRERLRSGAPIQMS